MNLNHAYLQDYAKDYVAGYSAIWPDVIAENLVKPNMNLPSLNANATLTRVRFRKGTGNGEAEVDAIVLDLTMPNNVHTERGAPSSLQTLIQCTTSTQIDLTVRWYEARTQRHTSLAAYCCGGWSPARMPSFHTFSAHGACACKRQYVFANDAYICRRVCFCMNVSGVICFLRHV